MATIEEALRAARGLAIAFSPAGTLAYSDAQVREFHALLTDRNYHTEAAILLARRMGEEHLAYELERVAALRDERGALRGLSDDGTPLKEKRDALVSEVERLWARGHRRSDAERHEEIELEDALNRAQHALDRAMLAASQRGIYGNRDEGVRAASAQVQAAKSALASARGRYRSEGRTGNPYGGRAENPPKKPVTVRFKPAELKAIAAQRGATYFVQSLERREAETGSWQEKVPGYFVASFLAGCQRHWTGLRYFRGNQVKIEPYGVNYDKPARSLSVSVKLDPNDTAAISEFTEVYVPSIVNGWIDAFETKARQEAALGAAGRTGNPSDEYAQVRSAIVNLRSFVKGSLSGEDAANTGRHWTVDQPIYANGGTSATHLNREAARRFDAAQARGELASSRGDQGWYVVFSQNLPIAWHTTADGWTVVDKSAVVGANPTTARNIAIVKGALGLR